MPDPNINFHPILSNKLVIAEPLKETDFDDLYKAASDPMIWEQHPNRNRYKEEEFRNYFKGAIESKGAFVVKDAQTNEIIGSSRYSDYIGETNTISIGYTFFTRSHWGTGHNYALKKLMLDYAFRFVHNVTFYIGALNKRSQISIERLGAVKTGEEEMAYYGETSKLNFIYTITKDQWQQLRKSLADY
ncbi:MAG: GNAT family N-acetyltransferase [Bacteroidota bacterium]